MTWETDRGKEGFTRKEGEEKPVQRKGKKSQ